MNKAVSLILCLLFCTPPAAAQQRNPPPPPRPRSFFEQNMGITRPGTATEQRREREPTLLERLIERARARAVAPAPAQESVPSPSSVTLSVDFNPTFCILNCTPPVNVRPSVTAARNSGVPAARDEGLTVDQILGRTSFPSSRGLPNSSEYGGGAVSIKGDPYGWMWSAADSAKINRIAEGVGRAGVAVTRGADELDRLTQQFAVVNQPTVPGVVSHVIPSLPWEQASSAPSARRTGDVTALAASNSPELPDECKRPQPTSPDVRCVVADYVYLRSDPGSFFINTLKKGDHFRVRARRDILKVDPDTGEKNKVCYFYGDALSLGLREVWVECGSRRLEEQSDKHPTPRPAVKPEFHKPGPYDPDDKTVTTRDHLYERFAASAYFPETPDGNDGRAVAVIKPEVGSAGVFSKYDSRERNDPLTHGFSDPFGAISADPSITPGVTLKVRYMTEDGQAYVVDYVVKHPDKTESKRWGFVSKEAVNIIMPPLPRWP